MGSPLTLEEWAELPDNEIRTRHLTWREGRGFVPVGDRSQKPETERRKFELAFVQFPKKVLDQIIKSTRNAELAVLIRLYELWFTNSKKNPIELSSVGFESSGISPHSKLRALKKLEKSGQITVKMRGTKSPLVTLNWLELKD